MAKKETFPEDLFAVFDDGHLVCGRELIAMVEAGEKVKVGFYKRVDIADVECKAVVVKN